MVVFFLSINGCFFPVNQWLFFSCQSMVVFFLSISQEFVRKIRGYFGLGLCSRLIVIVLMVNQRYDNVVTIYDPACMTLCHTYCALKAKPDP
jgi:hypothetical protein